MLVGEVCVCCCSTDVCRLKGASGKSVEAEKACAFPQWAARAESKKTPARYRIRINQFFLNPGAAIAANKVGGPDANFRSTRIDEKPIQELCLLRDKTRFVLGVNERKAVSLWYLI